MSGYVRYPKRSKFNQAEVRKALKNAGYDLSRVRARGDGKGIFVFVAIDDETWVADLVALMHANGWRTVDYVIWGDPAEDHSHHLTLCSCTHRDRDVIGEDEICRECGTKAEFWS